MLHGENAMVYLMSSVVYPVFILYKAPIVDKEFLIGGTGHDVVSMGLLNTVSCVFTHKNETMEPLSVHTHNMWL
jgi:hypothetical protein